MPGFSFFQYKNGKKVASWDTDVFTKHLKLLYYLFSISSEPVQVKAERQAERIPHICSGRKFVNINKESAPG